MTIPHTGSRKIVVDNIQYRWIVRSQPTYSQGLADAPLTFAVDLEDRPGSTLSVKMNGPRPDNWLGIQGAVVTPAIVQESVRPALSKGWHPDVKGSAYVLEL